MELVIARIDTLVKKDYAGRFAASALPSNHDGVLVSARPHIPTDGIFFYEPSADHLCIQDNAHGNAATERKTMGMMNDIWRYRHFIVSSIQSELASRFVRSRLGGLWMIINPLAQVLMYTLILSAVLSARLPGMDTRFAYAIYLLAGILGWSLFAEVVDRCSRVFIDNAGMMKKMVFPRICLPLIVMGSALLNSLFLFIAGFFVFIVLGHVPGANLVWLPVVMAINLFLAAGLGLVLGVFNVFVRDVGQMVGLALQYGFWFTPIVYMPGIIPENLQVLLRFNPLYWVVTSYQNILVFHRAPHWSGLALVSVCALLLLFLALFLFRRAAPEMVDVL